MIGWMLVAAAVMLMPARPSPRRTTTGGARTVAAPVLLSSLIAIAAALVLLLGALTGSIAAAVVLPLAWVLVRRVPVGGVSTVADGDPGVPLVLDLAAAALRAGRPLADALTAAAPAAPGAVQHLVERVAGLLRLGAAPQQAWSVMPPSGALTSVAAVAMRSAESGARLASAFERLATELRADATSAAAARAQRAGVVAMAPLGACFLPAFVLLGVVPTVVGIARTIVGDLP